MSSERARKALRGEPTDVIPLFSMPAHRHFLRQLTGIDPLAEEGRAVERAMCEAIRKLDIDLLFCTFPERIGTRESDPDLYGLETTVWRHAGSTRTDLFAYDPARDRPWDAAMDETAFQERCEHILGRLRRLVGDTALPHGFCFTTCIHYAAEDLDWESFLVACQAEEEKVRRLLDRFQAAGEKIMRAWARTDVEVMLAHDDIATAHGLTFSPAWLRRNLFPRYRRILAPLKSKGIPVLFMTDGDFLPVAADLVEAGADGFFLDQPCMDLEALVARCGRDLVYFTGPSPATMTTGTPRDVHREIARLAGIGRELPRFFFHMPGGFPHNVPAANVAAFYEACRQYGRR
jgi:hypothetical protein